MGMPKMIKIWFAKAKDGLLMMFTSEPQRKGDIWVGNHYVNSIIQANLEKMLSSTKYGWEDDPQYIEFQLNTEL